MWVIDAYKALTDLLKNNNVYWALKYVHGYMYTADFPYNTDHTLLEIYYSLDDMRYGSGKLLCCGIGVPVKVAESEICTVCSNRYHCMLVPTVKGTSFSLMRGV